MPVASITDQFLLSVANCTKDQLDALRSGPRHYPFPIDTLVSRVVSDRIALAGEHLRAGDGLIFTGQFRSAISRHYYAMYHSARAVTFAETGGDDHQVHRKLPRHLPSGLSDYPKREGELMSARLLRNEADYDPYPANAPDWQDDARMLSTTAAEFVQACDDYAHQKGYV